MVGAIETRRGAIYVEETYRLVLQADGRRCIRAQPRRAGRGDPKRVGACIGDNDWLAGGEHLLKVRRLVHGKDKVTRVPDAESLVAMRAGDTRMIVLNEHDVGRIVGHHAADLVQQASRDCAQIQCGGQRCAGLAQRLGQLALLSLGLIEASVLDGNGGLCGEQVQ